MIRIVTDATLNRLRQERDDARQAAEHESADAAIVREERFENMDALAAARQETKDTFEGMLAVIKQVTRERDEAREQLRQLAAEAPAGSEAELPRVFLYLRYGIFRAVAATAEGAQAAAERVDAVPSWAWKADGPREDRDPRDLLYTVRSWPVVGVWPDPEQIWVVLDYDRPVGVYGTRAAADQAVIADQLGLYRKAVRREQLLAPPVSDVALSQPEKTPKEVTS